MLLIMVGYNFRLNPWASLHHVHALGSSNGRPYLVSSGGRQGALSSVAGSHLVHVANKACNYKVSSLGGVVDYIVGLSWSCYPFSIFKLLSLFAWSISLSSHITYPTNGQLAEQSGSCNLNRYDNVFNGYSSTGSRGQCYPESISGSIDG